MFTVLKRRERTNEYLPPSGTVNLRKIKGFVRRGKGSRLIKTIVSLALPPLLGKRVFTLLK